MARLVRGGPTLERTIACCTSLRTSLETRVVVILEFPPVAEARDDARVWASNISTRAKRVAFERIGLPACVEQVQADASISELAARLSDLSSAPEVLAVILQQPIPARLQPALHALAAEKDLDAVAGRGAPFAACAAAEASIRLVRHFGHPGDRVAVVGGGGFVGSAVVRSLEADRVFVVEREHDLDRVRDAAVIVTAAGRPNLLDRRHLRGGHRLLVDVGFTPLSMSPLIIRGDIDPEACPPDAFLTPVPGGVGPLQVAVLLERAAQRVAQVEFPPWEFEVR